MAKEIKEVAEATELKAIVGKKVVEVKPKIDWRGNDVDGVIISFDDGSSIEIGCISNNGCENCDPDGCNDATLTVWPIPAKKA